MTPRNPNGTQAVDRALAVLRLLATTGGAGLSLAEVRENTGLAKATAHRLLHALLRHGLATQDPESRIFRVATEVSMLGWPLAGRASRLRQVGALKLRELVRATDDAASILMRSGNDVVCIDCDFGSGPARPMTPYIWMHLPLGAGASSAAILAHMQPLEAEQIIQRNSPHYKRLPSLSEATVRRSVMRARVTGYGLATGVSERDMRGLAMAIRVGGEPIGALVLNSLERRMRPARVRNLRPILDQQRRAIEAELAASP